MRGALAVAVAWSWLVGCGADAPPGVPEEPAPPAPELHDARFVGLWLVEQPFHALYEATFYELGADGAVREGPSDPAGCAAHLGEHCVTGSVADAATGTSCVFGERWRSLDPATLVVRGACDDGRARDIVLAFDPDPSGNAESAGVVLASVGGETTWAHDNWEWSFRKCAPDAIEDAPHCCYLPDLCH